MPYGGKATNTQMKVFDEVCVICRYATSKGEAVNKIKNIEVYNRKIGEKTAKEICNKYEENNGAISRRKYL